MHYPLSRISLSELIRVSIFISGITAIYVAVGATSISRFLRRLNGSASQADRREINFRRVLYAFAGLGVLCFAYGYFVEPYWIEITHIRVASPKLSKGAHPIRIVQISDLHSEAKPRLEKYLPDIIAREHPDLIAFTGDAINSVQGLAVFKSCLTRLARSAPTFVVRGNWDKNRKDLFGNTGARELRGEVAELNIRGVGLWVAGAPFDNRVNIPRILSGVPPGALTLFLYHSSDEIVETARLHIDLYLAGDTHGGQVALPFYGALVTESKFGKRFEGGLYRVNQTWLYVNRGIGMDGEFPLPVRFFARPEVTVIEIVPAT